MSHRVVKTLIEQASRRYGSGDTRRPFEVTRQELDSLGAFLGFTLPDDYKNDAALFGMVLVIEDNPEP